MPIIPEIQDRLRLAFPPRMNAPLLRAVQEGSFLADHVCDGESFLNNVLGHDVRGHIRRVGISHQIAKYCERGDLDLLAEMKPMPKGRWHWLEIKSTGAIAHVCRTDDAFKFPEEADSRQDVRLTLQTDLLSWRPTARPTLSQIIHEVPKLYAWLTFRIGHDGLVSHLCWASPAADCDDWIGHVNILDEVAKSGATVAAPATSVDPRDKIRLKDHVAKAIADAASKKSGT